MPPHVRNRAAQAPGKRIGRSLHQCRVISRSLEGTLGMPGDPRQRGTSSRVAKSRFRDECSQFNGCICECVNSPECRHHHRCKQAEGWRLEQPEPGVLVWHTPTGRSYTTTPTQYAA